MTAENLGSAAGLEEALRSGDISATQANVLLPAMEADSSAAEELLQLAAKAPLSVLREQCERVKAAKRSELEAKVREQRLRDRRHLRIWTSDEGAVCLKGELPTMEGGVVKNALERAARSVFSQARRQGLRESHEAYRADALVALCRTGYVEEPPAGTPARPAEPANDVEPAIDATSPSDRPLSGADPASDRGHSATATAAALEGAAPASSAAGAARARPEDVGARRLRPGPPAAEVIIHVDATVLARGELEGGERCEIEGIGPVSLSTLEYLFGNAWARVIITKGVAVANVTHLGRVIPAHLETAVRKRDKICAVPGCGVSYGLECDHVVPFTERGPTSLDNLVLLCHVHHLMKTHHFWRLEGPPGNRRWLQLKPGPGEVNRQAGNGGKTRQPSRQAPRRPTGQEAGRPVMARPVDELAGIRPTVSEVENRIQSASARSAVAPAVASPQSVASQAPGQSRQPVSSPAS
ncbi:MAG: HNH endonuclease signature motif containing protein [Acidimicrobiales bacterium]